MFRSSNIGLIEEALTESVFGSFYEVYNQLGFGFLESIYSKALEVSCAREIIACFESYQCLSFTKA